MVNGLTNNRAKLMVLEVEGLKNPIRWGPNIRCTAIGPKGHGVLIAICKGELAPHVSFVIAYIKVSQKL